MAVGISAYTEHVFLYSSLEVKEADSQDQLNNLLKFQIDNNFSKFFESLRFKCLF